MVIGLVGKGYWGSVYAGVLDGMGVEYWHKGRDWTLDCDGLIIASSTYTHFDIAREALSRGVPVLIEKPVSTTSIQARELVSLGGIAYAGHTRLYDPLWPEFKASVGVPVRVEAWAGGVNAGNPDAELNWWVHLAAMCWDLGFDPANAVFHIEDKKRPLAFECNGKLFTDSRGGVSNLIRAFMAAIERGEPDNEGLKLGVKTLEYVEEMKCRSLTSQP